MRRDSHGGSEQVAQAQAGDGGGPVDGGLVWEVEPPKLGEGEIRRERGPRREARAATWVWAPEQGRASVQGAGVAADMGDGAHTGGGPSQCKHCRRRETLLTGEERVCSGRDSVELATRLTRGFPHRQGNSKSASVCVSLDAHAHADTHTNTP